MSAAEELAAQVAYQARRAGVKALMDYRLDGTTPFGPTPADLAHQCFSQARGLCVLFETAFNDADGSGDGVDNLRGSIVAQAFDGIGTLIGLGMFGLEGGR